MTGSPVLPEANVVTTPHGEVIDLATADTTLLARSVDELKDWTSRAREAESMLKEELRRRMGRERSLTAGSFTVAKSVKNDWDRSGTWAALSDLVGAGLITAKDADEAMPERTERRPDGRKLNAMRERLFSELDTDDPEAAALVQALIQAKSTVTFVTVKRVAVDGTAEEVAA